MVYDPSMSMGVRSNSSLPPDSRPKRIFEARLVAACPFSVAQDYTLDYLRSPQPGNAEATVRVPIRYFPTALSRHVALTYGPQPDRTEVGRAHDEIRIEWDPRTFLLPKFRGTIRFRIAGLGTAVFIEGSYTISFGVLGRLFDEAIGQYVARASVRDLLSRIASHLEVQQSQWRKGIEEDSSARHASAVRSM